MKILLTGASSFTGFWFVKAIAKHNHEIWATYRKKSADLYDGVREERVRQTLSRVNPVFGCEFGTESFIQTVQDARVDVICHHGAFTTNHKSPEFKLFKAVKSNTKNLPELLGLFKKIDGALIVLTETTYSHSHSDNRNGSDALSPYGLSKGFTTQLFEYYCDLMDINLTKFVISNPFGPFEDEDTFTSYMGRKWSSGGIVRVREPYSVRDNIHVEALANAYNTVISRLSEGGRYRQEVAPAGYIEEQGNFAKRMARQIRMRLGWSCEVEYNKDHNPNPDEIRHNKKLWHTKVNTEECWKSLAEYFEKKHN
ncbi:MAG: NAD-dependent epimerase/dehydratase family protein [Candidatus Paceibacteria bacterium]